MVFWTILNSANILKYLDFELIQLQKTQKSCYLHSIDHV